MHDEVSGVRLYQPRVWPPSRLPAAEVKHMVTGRTQLKVLSCLENAFGKVHRNLDFLSSNYTIMPQGPPGCAQRINGPTSHCFLGS